MDKCDDAIDLDRLSKQVPLVVHYAGDIAVTTLTDLHAFVDAQPDGVVLLFFTDAGCAQCEDFLPAIQASARDHENLVLVNVPVEEVPDLACQYHVTQAPSVVMLRERRVVARVEAPVTAKELGHQLARVLAGE